MTAISLKLYCDCPYLYLIGCNLRRVVHFPVYVDNYLGCVVIFSLRAVEFVQCSIKFSFFVVIKQRPLKVSHVLWCKYRFA